MNRAVVYLGIGVILAGLALVSFPIAVTGEEQFDPEQESGFLVAPVGLVVVMFGASFSDPRRTTIGGAFGNPDLAPRKPGAARPPTLGPSTFHPHESVACRYCRTPIAYVQASCPRCARARPCRSCGRPLGLVLDRATCPYCARAEAFCNCPRLTALGADPERSGWGG